MFYKSPAVTRLVNSSLLSLCLHCIYKECVRSLLLYVSSCCFYFSSCSVCSLTQCVLILEMSLMCCTPLWRTQALRTIFFPYYSTCFWSGMTILHSKGYFILLYFKVDQRLNKKTHSKWACNVDRGSLLLKDFNCYSIPMLLFLSVCSFCVYYY